MSGNRSARWHCKKRIPHNKIIPCRRLPLQVVCLPENLSLITSKFMLLRVTCILEHHCGLYFSHRHQHHKARRKCRQSLFFYDAICLQRYPCLCKRSLLSDHRPNPTDSTTLYVSIFKIVSHLSDPSAVLTCNIVCISFLTLPPGPSASSGFDICFCLV